MKKSLLALAALTAFAGAASAQSSVTLFGIVDAGLARLSVKTTSLDANGNRIVSSKSVTGMENSGLNSSRIGFRGVEDIGGGLKGAFHIEGQLFNDTGDGSSTGGSMDWRRRSTVSLMGGFGEVRLGRDYTTNFNNVAAYDPFGVNGVGTTSTVGMVGGAGNGVAAVRTNNSIGYFTPALGGFALQAQYAFGENLSGGAKTNNHWGLRVGYAAGPVSVHANYAKTEGATQTINGVSNDSALDVKYMSVGGSFAAGPVTPMLLFAQEKTGAGLKVQGIQAGLLVNLGAGTIRASYGRFNQKGSSGLVTANTQAARDALALQNTVWNANDWNKIAVGYVHNLSKRTAVYATYARTSNKGVDVAGQSDKRLTGQVVRPGTNGLAVTLPTGTSLAGANSHSGMEFGIRHAF